MSYRLTEGNRKNFAAIEDTTLELVKSTEISGQVVLKYTDDDKLAISGLLPNYQLGKNKSIASVIMTDPVFNLRTEVKDVGWDFEVSGHLGEHGYLDTIQLHRLNDLSGAGTVNPKQIESLDTYRLGVTGNTVLSGSLTVSGLSTKITSNIINLSGILTQTGEAEFVSGVTIDKSLLVKTTTTLSGKVTALSGLEVTGISKFNSNIDAKGQHISGQSLTLTETADVKIILANSGSIDILQVTHSGNITNLTATDAKISGLLVKGISTLSGKVTISGGLDVSGQVNLLNGLKVNGEISGTTLTLSQKATINNLEVTSGFVKNLYTNSGYVNTFSATEAKISGLTVSGASTLNGKVTANTGLEVAGQVTFKNDQYVSGNVSISGNATISGNTTITGNTNISGNLIVKNDISGKSLALTNNLYASSGYISGIVSTSGRIDSLTSSSAQVSGLTVSGFMSAATASISSGLINHLEIETLKISGATYNHGITTTSGLLVTETDVWSAVNTFSGLIDNFLVNMKAAIHQELWATVAMLFDPPAAISELTGTSAINTGAITFTWTNPEDIDLKEIIIESADARYLDGTTWANIHVPQTTFSGKKQNTYTLSGLAFTIIPELETLSSPYNFVLKAVDRDGQQSEGIATASIPVKENISLRDRISYPAPTDGTVKLTWKIRDASAVPPVMILKRDDEELEVTFTKNDYTYSYIDTDGAIGPHVYSIITQDSETNPKVVMTSTTDTITIPDYLTPTSIWVANMKTEKNGNYNKIVITPNPITIINHDLLKSVSLVRIDTTNNDDEVSISLNKNDYLTKEQIIITDNNSLIVGHQYVYKITTVSNGTEQTRTLGSLLVEAQAEIDWECEDPVFANTYTNDPAPRAIFKIENLPEIDTDNETGLLVKKYLSIKVSSDSDAVYLYTNEEGTGYPLIDGEITGLNTPIYFFYDKAGKNLEVKSSVLDSKDAVKTSSITTVTINKKSGTFLPTPNNYDIASFDFVTQTVSLANFVWPTDQTILDQIQSFEIDVGGAITTIENKNGAMTSLQTIDIDNGFISVSNGVVALNVRARYKAKETSLFGDYSSWKNGTPDSSIIIPTLSTITFDPAKLHDIGSRFYDVKITSSFVGTLNLYSYENRKDIKTFTAFENGTHNSEFDATDFIFHIDEDVWDHVIDTGNNFILLLTDTDNNITEANKLVIDKDGILVKNAA
jgi:cytoskeletal protein CcmA (bactofilin family)